MKGVRLFLVLGIAVLALAYLVFSPPDRANRKIPTADSVNDLVIGEPIVFRNLAIFPVSSKMLRNDDRFITLDEGLKAGTVEILERGVAPAAAAPDANDPFAPLATDPFAPVTANENSRVQQPAPAADPFADALPEGARRESELPAMPERRRSSGNSVNQLMVVNSSGKPLYLMPGEIVVGGSQDRAIGQELVVAPDKKAVPIDVFCVEHGRWGGRAPDTYARLLASTAGEGEPIAGFAANLSLSVAETAEVANAGKFVGSAGSLNAHGRLAVQKDKDQQKVWDEVAKQNAKNSVETASGTFTANYSEADSIDRLTPFLEELLKPIDETDNVVGVIVAVNGQVASMDVFASTPLFRKLWPKLLKSYALDAVNADDGQADAEVATHDQALAFLHEVAKAQGEKIDTHGDLAVLQCENERALLFSAHERRPEDVGGSASFRGVGMGGMGGGAFGGAIHAAGFAK